MFYLYIHVSSNLKNYKGWFVCAGFIYGLIPGLNFLSSLAISACLTPTDPILASAVIGGKWADKHVPGHLRHLLAAESGCNDGAAFPFLFFALYLMTDLPSVGNGMRDWFVILWLCECFYFPSQSKKIVIPCFFFRPDYSRDYSRFLPRFLLQTLDEILSTSRLYRQTVLRGSIPLSGDPNLGSKQPPRFQRCPGRIRMRHLFRMGRFFQ